MICIIIPRAQVASREQAFIVMSIVEDRGPQLLVVCIVLLSISIFSLTLRVWTRIFIVRAFDRDDYLMVAAAVSAAIVSSIIYIMTQLTTCSKDFIYTFCCLCDHRRSLWNRETCGGSNSGQFRRSHEGKSFTTLRTADLKCSFTNKSRTSIGGSVISGIVSL